LVFSKKQHTDKSFDAELDGLRARLLTLGGKVESEIASSVKALIERDSNLAEEVIGSDREVNVMEVEIDESCRRLLALRQPAASDLRFITTALKIVVDLERIGDLAVNVAERAIDLNQSPPLRPVHDLVRLADHREFEIRAMNDGYTLDRLFNRHLRWAQMRRRVAPLAYLGEGLLNPPLWIALAGCALTVSGRGLDLRFAAVGAGTLLVKCAADALLWRRLSGSAPPLTGVLLMPLKDLPASGRSGRSAARRPISGMPRAGSRSASSSLAASAGPSALARFSGPAPCWRLSCRRC
jgi:hypothetical protein